MTIPGGKGQTFHRLINLIPPHDVYIETHLGAGSVIKNKLPAKKNIAIEIDPAVITKWKKSGTEINFDLIWNDALVFLKTYTFQGNEFVYCDPPYLRSTRKRSKALYKYEYSDEMHIQLLELLKTLPCMVMISGYESTLYNEVLGDWNTYTYQSSTHHGFATEWVWMNYPSPTALHDYRFLGDDFREREQIRIKLQRWVTRFKNMRILERQALLQELQAITVKEKS